MGNYRLLPQFSSAARSADELTLMSSYSIHEIVDRVLENKDFQPQAEGMYIIAISIVMF